MSTMQSPRSEWEPDPNQPEMAKFESFARNAGASLRSAAPEDGMAAVQRQGIRQRNRRMALEIGVVVALAVVGVAVFTQPHGPQPNVNTPPADTVVSTTDPRLDQWFVDYTGNPPGPALGEPVKFGVVMPSFIYQYDLQAAARYLNEQAGGVGGRPIELDVCQLALAECADQFAADPAIIAVLENQWSGDSISAPLAGRKPLHTTYSGDGTEGVSYYPTYRETVNAMALQAEKLTTRGQRVLVIDAAVHPADIQDPSLARFVTPDVSAMLTDRDVVTVNSVKGRASRRHDSPDRSHRCNSHRPGGSTCQRTRGASSVPSRL